MSTKSIILIVIGGLVGSFILFIAVLLLFVNTVTKASYEVSNNFISYIQENDSKKAYELTTDSLKSATSFLTFETYVESISVLDWDNARTLSKSVDNGVAEFEYSVKNKNDDSKYLASVQLVKSGENWLVQYVNVEKY